MKLSFIAHSETGPVRKNNQDSGYASPRLLVVADGMGGAAAGDLASAVAIDQFRRVDERAAADRDHTLRGEDMLALLAGAITRANDKIADLVADDPELEGMGTTVSAYLFDGDRLALAHIGDSRAYLMRDGELRRTTHDHSWVQSLIDEGKITEEEAATHPHRNLLLKVLNGQAATEPDLELVDIEPGDRLLICSDGLSGLTDDESITRAMRRPELTDALDELIDLAHAGGGIDNITIVLADVQGDEERPAATGTGEAAVAPLGEPVTNDDGTEDTLVRTPPAVGAGSDAPAEALEPIVLGAATERAIPAVRHRTAAERAAAESDEQLLVESERDDEHERYAPTSPPRRRWLRIALGVLAAVVLLGIGALAGNAWIGTQYYVGVAGENVAIYRGLPDDVAGVPLSQVSEVTETRVSDLPRYFRDRVAENIRASDLPGARNTVAELRAAAELCIAQRNTEPPLDPQPTPTAPPGPTPGTGESVAPGASPSAGATPAPRDTGSANPSPTTTSPTPGVTQECG